MGPWDEPTIHRITGNISFPTPTSLVIDGFNYDGNGIGQSESSLESHVSVLYQFGPFLVVVYLYYYAPEQVVDDVSGRILPLSNGDK